MRAEFTLHEAELLEHARGESVDAFVRRCRALAREIVAAHATNDADELDRQRAASRIKRWVGREDGMHHTHVSLDPRRDAALLRALNAAVARRRQVDGNARTPYHQLEVDAFIDLLSGGVIDESPVGRPTDHGSCADARSDREPAAGPSGVDDPGAIERMARQIDARLPEITVIIDLATLLDGLHANSICETDDGVPLPVSTIRRLCCDAEVLPVVLDGEGVVLDEGRSKRTATPDQRRALRSMHRTCAGPDCTVPFSQTRAHHIRWWKRDTGETDIDNLVPVCERCHHLVHEGGWTLTMTPERIVTWTRPDGTVYTTGPAHDRSSGRRPAHAA